MSAAYDKILRILADVEAEEGVPPDILKKIYNLEKPLIHYRTRTMTHNELRAIIAETVQKGKQDAP